MCQRHQLFFVEARHAQLRCHSRAYIITWSRPTVTNPEYFRNDTCHAYTTRHVFCTFLTPPPPPPTTKGKTRVVSLWSKKKRNKCVASWFPFQATPQNGPRALPSAPRRRQQLRGPRLLGRRAAERQLRLREEAPEVAVRAGQGAVALVHQPGLEDKRRAVALLGNRTKGVGGFRSCILLLGCWWRNKKQNEWVVFAVGCFCWAFCGGRMVLPRTKKGRKSRGPELLGGPLQRVGSSIQEQCCIVYRQSLFKMICRICDCRIELVAAHSGTVNALKPNSQTTIKPSHL